MKSECQVLGRFGVIEEIVMRKSALICLFACLWLCGCEEGSGRTPNGGSCDYDSDCESDYCSGASLCSDPNGVGGSIANGAACTSNEQCASNNCYEGKVCRAPNWGGSSSGGSSKTPNGSACTSNSECESNNCYEGKICRAPNWGGSSSGGSSKTPNGSACTSNSECESNNCYEGKICRAPNWGGSGSGGTGTGGSSTTGRTQTQLMKDYCDYLMNNCNAKSMPYRNAEQCAIQLDMLRDEYPSCTAQWDKAYSCYVTSSCSEVRDYATPISEKVNLSSFNTPGYCKDFVVEYINCARNSNYNNSVNGYSNSNQAYCKALIDDCNGGNNIYRNSEACEIQLDMLRDKYPKCTGQWDKAYSCYVTSSCSEIRDYATPISEKVTYSSFNVPGYCKAFVKEYIDCAKN